MLELKVYDRGTDVVLKFEHSLLSVSKWESIHKTPFLSSAGKTAHEMLDYYQCMLMSPEGSEDLIFRLSPEQMEALTEYMNSNPTASTPPTPEPTASRHTGEVITSEFIYYQMVALRIPFEAEKWHLSRLMMLIAITSDRQKPPSKKSKPALLSTWEKINQKNREYFNSKG